MPVFHRPYTSLRACAAIALAGWLLSGCSTAMIQEQFEHARKIQTSCNAIQEAVPLRDEQLTNALIDTFAMRLLGACDAVDGSCVNNPDLLRGASGMTTSLLTLRATTSVELAALKVAGQTAAMAAKTSLLQLEGDFTLLGKDIDTQKEATLAALRAFKEALEKARTDLRGATAGKCTQRTACMNQLSKVIASNQVAIVQAAMTFQKSLEGAKRIRRSAADLAIKTRLFRNQLAADGIALQQAVIDSGNNMDAAIADVAREADDHGKRLQMGLASLARLASADVKSASVDLLAWKVSSKAAEPLLALVDRMLGQVDLAIEKADSRVYAVVSLGVTMYSPKIQVKFDDMFTKLIADQATGNPPTTSAKLAFASAACDRLGMGDTPAVPTSSMFAPFLYATLANVEAEVMAKANAKPGASEEAFRLAINQAVVQDVAANLAPSVQAQTTLCAGTEQLVADKANADPVQARELGLAACGKRVLAAVASATPIHAPQEAATAAQAVDAHLKSEAAKTTQGNGASEWGTAMQAVMASIHKTSSDYDILCKKIEAKMQAARCDSGKDGIVLDFKHSFEPGQTRDNELELSLASVADVLSAYKRSFRVGVLGYASQKLPRCTAKVAKADERACSIAQNAALAKARADWASAVLRSRMAQYYAAGSDTMGLRDQVSFDTPFDRRVRVNLAFQD